MRERPSDGDEDTGLVWLEAAVGRQREKTGRGRQ